MLRHQAKNLYDEHNLQHFQLNYSITMNIVQHNCMSLNLILSRTFSNYLYRTKACLKINLIEILFIWNKYINKVYNKW